MLIHRRSQTFFFSFFFALDKWACTLFNAEQAFKLQETAESWPSQSGAYLLILSLRILLHTKDRSRGFYLISAFKNPVLWHKPFLRENASACLNRLTN